MATERDFTWKTIPTADYRELLRARVDFAILQTQVSAVLQSLHTEVYTLEQIRQARYNLAKALDLSLSDSPPSLLPTPPPPLRPVPASSD